MAGKFLVLFYSAALPDSLCLNNTYTGNRRFFASDSLDGLYKILQRQQKTQQYLKKNLNSYVYKFIPFEISYRSS